METLKKLFTMLFVAVAFIGFTACEDDDDNGDNGGGTGDRPTVTFTGNTVVNTDSTTTISLTISAPNNIDEVTAVASEGTVSVENVTGVGTTSGSADLVYVAPATAGNETITVTVNDGEGLEEVEVINITVSEAGTVVLPPSQPGDQFSFFLDTKNGEEVVRTIGTINRNFTFSSEFSWLLSGGVFVGEDATLTIEPGTVIYGDADSQSPSFLAVNRGGMINADGGDASGVIVMTSSNAIGGGTADPGDWGGLVINGRAAINTESPALGEGNTGLYGPNQGDAAVNDENSGTIRYLRLEYAGRIIGVDNELNGFSFNGVGTATTIEYIQAYRGSDDGIEFFGGRARVKYASAIGNQDDSFDWTDGWQGYGQFWHVINDDGDHGFEADNNGDENDAEPFSNPRIANVTIVGNAVGDGGMLLREGTKGIIWNAIVTGFTDDSGDTFKGFGIGLDQAQTQTNANDGSLDVVTSLVFGNEVDFTAFVDSDDASTEYTNPFNDQVPAGADPTNITATGIGVVDAIGTDPSAVDGWFTQVQYIGAVPADNNWLAGWALQPDGSVY